MGGSIRAFYPRHTTHVPFGILARPHMRSFVPEISRDAIIATAILASALVSGGVIAWLLSSIAYERAPVAVGQDAPASAVSQIIAEPERALTIANSGLVYASGLKVTAIGGGTITSTIAWASGSFPWTVTADFGTHFVRPGGSVGKLTDIKVGDFLTVSGTLMPVAGQNAINATTIRDVSLGS